jgi:branched-chain amino acid transport system substrate-binding protein
VARSTRPAAIAVGLVAVMVAFAGCSKSASETPTTGAATGEPIIIGLDQDSTGPGASYSNIAGKTIRLAVQDINDKGGVMGRA